MARTSTDQKKLEAEREAWRAMVRALVDVVVKQDYRIRGLRGALTRLKAKEK